jgi:hypothetical protein
MYRQYRAAKFRPETAALITRIESILSEYGSQKLTARQVYYQCVSRNWLANTEANYKRLTSTLTDARYAGLVDWDMIEDRGRVPELPTEWDDLSDLVDAALNSYRLPRWEDQANYVELWVEKQALAGVLAPIARKWHVTLMVNKGYSSSSSMKDAADRIAKACSMDIEIVCANCEIFDEDNGNGVKICTDCGAKWKPKAASYSAPLREPIVLYLGDHDPSGEDMVRDIRDRLAEFGTETDVRKLALTMDQIRKFNPPPNPAKLSDSRAKAYIAKYGAQSWELDALPPRELNRLVERAIKNLVDEKQMAAVIAREDLDKQRLREAVKAIVGEKS